jgi:pimeloyl-ACP methyl ester carboxylesterase
LMMRTEHQQQQAQELGFKCAPLITEVLGEALHPKEKKATRKTLTMAKDALALMDHLGWNNTHVVGHSMGGMIACKLGAIAPERVVSLALISTTGGGYECLPKV